MADDGKWITVNGTPILLKDGQDAGAAIKEKFGGVSAGGGLKKWGEKKLASRSQAAPGKMSPDTHTMTKATIDKVKVEVEKGGQLKAGASLGDHVRIAKDVIGKHDADLSRSKAELKTIAATLGPPPGTVKGRVKKLDSALGKIERKASDARAKDGATKYKTVADLQDTTGLRVVAHSIKDVESAVEKIRSQNKVVEEDNYLHKTQGGAYRSHHLIIQTPGGLVKEVQVRTARQNTHADWAHKVYKPETPAQEKALKEHAPEIHAYSKAVSEHFYAKDQGKSGTTMPKAPPSVERHFGAIHDE